VALIPLSSCFLGVFWCANLPFATLSDLIQIVVGRQRTGASLLKKYGIWIIDAVFHLDHLVGPRLRDSREPRGSGYLLLALSSGCDHRSFLREADLVPITSASWEGFPATTSRAGAMELRATPSKCAKCTVQACYRGSDKAAGADVRVPSNHGHQRSVQFCGYCVKSCLPTTPSESSQNSHQELWGILGRSSRVFPRWSSWAWCSSRTSHGRRLKGILAWLEGATGTDSYFVTFTFAA